MVEKGYMVYEVWKPGHYQCQVEYSITSSLLVLITWLIKIPSLMTAAFNLYSAEMEIMRRKTLIPPLAKMVAIFLYIIKPIAFSN